MKKKGALGARSSLMTKGAPDDPIGLGYYPTEANGKSSFPLGRSCQVPNSSAGSIQQQTISLASWYTQQTAPVCRMRSTQPPPQSQDRDSGINDGSSALGPQSNNPMKFQLVFAARFNHDPTWRLIQIVFSQSTHTFPFFLSNQRILDSITSVSDHHFRSIHQDRSGPSGPSSIKRQVCGECRPASNDVD